jgi:hypothetical protein
MSAKIETIPANVLKVNPDYIRVRVGKDHVGLMVDKLKESKGVWPFPPIKVQPIPITEEKIIKEGYRYYIIDGHNRAAAALTEGVPVQAEVYSGLTKIESICMQVKTNIENGLAFNLADRRRAVALMSKEGLKQIEICQKTNLPKYTVSRILSENPKMNVADTEKDGRKAPKVPGSKPFDTEKWEKMLYKLMEGWGTQRKKIIKTKGFPEGLAEALDTVQDAITPEESTEGEK